MEFLLWLRGLRTQHWLSKDAGLIPGLTQGVKDPPLLQAVVQVADVAWILCGCGLQMKFQFNPQPGNFHMPLKKKKKSNDRIGKNGQVQLFRTLEINQMSSAIQRAFKKNDSLGQDREICGILNCPTPISFSVVLLMKNSSLAAARGGKFALELLQSFIPREL